MKSSESEEMEMSKLNAIIAKADTKKQEWIVCHKCKGEGMILGYAHVQTGKCFNCFGKGKVENKWLKIKNDAVALKNEILECAKH